MLAANSARAAELSRGFVAELAGNATGEELTAQPDLWALNVQFKPLRMMWIELPDPKTGEKKKELITYLIYRISSPPLVRPPVTIDNVPVNDDDPRPSPPQFAPELTLVTEDNGRQQVYHDQILPEAQAAIERRERMKLLNSVQIVGTIPEPAASDTAEGESRNGVAIWRGVDPTADFFKIFMTGFSNGFQTKPGADGKPIVWRRTIVQDFARPGDEFVQNETEVNHRNPPEWIYRPDE